MTTFISESITPSGPMNAARMGRAEPGLPRSFRWRGESYGVASVEATWKESSREGGRAQADLYLRRHYYRVRMKDGAVWTIYFERQTPRGRDPKRRWFLYTVKRRASNHANTALSDLLRR